MRILAILLALVLPLTALAQDQDRPNTILVLDGSGSMWGQIDGTAKITIAQDVVRGLLGSIPEDQALGLTVYGHRERGDCSDIETIVAPGAGTRAAIADAVGGIKPLGKTPMTDAVIAAANALRYTEEKATVILVSDGVETCNPDPCAAARLLEEAGIDFTAHVVGFDVGSDPEALAQMQCIAAETGGQFLTAENADELATALVTVAAEPAPPAVYTITFRGIAGPGGPVISDPLVWSISGPAGQVADAQSAPTLAIDLTAGDYAVSALWPQYEEFVDLTARVAGPGIVDVVFPAPPPPPVEITFVATDGRNGPRINDPLEWQFFQDGAQLGDTLTGATITGSLPRGAYRVVVTRPVDGATAEETFGVGTVNATVTLTLPEFRPPATIAAPAEAIAGSTIDVIWTGPDGQGDYISSAVPDGPRGAYETYTYTREGPLLKLTVPAEPGEYELRYVLADGNKTLVAVPLTVVPVGATISMPEEGTAGASIEVTWTGPDYQNDFIAVAKPDDKDGTWINYTYTREGSPMKLVLPTEPGEYEVRYTLNQDRVVIARVPITVTAVGASITLPETAVAGDTIEVGWTGPDYQNDFIAVSKPDDKDGTWINYTYTREGAPLELQMPPEPGEYEVRYTLNQDRVVIARATITVTALTASLDAPESVIAGAALAVGWTGPDYRNDFISISEVDAREGTYETYTYTREGTPLTVAAPLVPGTYELRYVLNQDKKTAASRTIEVLPVTARLEATDSAPAGAELEVTWTGPDYRNDFVSVARPGDNPGAYENYTNAREGSPLSVTMPAIPGSYELRYVSRGKPITVIATRPIEVTAVEATLSAPGEAKIGQTIRVEWTGPGYRNDRVEIARPGERGRESRAFLRDGSPVSIEAPEQPGTYELRYVMDEDNTVLATLPLNVSE